MTISATFQVDTPNTCRSCPVRASRCIPIIFSLALFVLVSAACAAGEASIEPVGEGVITYPGGSVKMVGGQCDDKFLNNAPALKMNVTVSIVTFYYGTDVTEICVDGIAKPIPEGGEIPGSGYRFVRAIEEKGKITILVEEIGRRG